MYSFSSSFQLFTCQAYLYLISTYIKLKVSLKLAINKDKEKRKSESDILEQYEGNIDKD